MDGNILKTQGSTIWQIPRFEVEERREYSWGSQWLKGSINCIIRSIITRKLSEWTMLAHFADKSEIGQCAPHFSLSLEYLSSFSLNQMNDQYVVVMGILTCFSCISEN